MSKRHFEAVARVLRDALEHEQFADSRAGARVAESIARELADVFADENPRFDRARFLRACGVEDAA